MTLLLVGFCLGVFAAWLHWRKVLAGNVTLLCFDDGGSFWKDWRVLDRATQAILDDIEKREFVEAPEELEEIRTVRSVRLEIAHHLYEKEETILIAVRWPSDESERFVLSRDPLDGEINWFEWNWITMGVPPDGEQNRLRLEALITAAERALNSCTKRIAAAV